MVIEIDALGKTPIYEQLRDQIVLGMAAGKIVPGEALPSVRRLAAQLGVNFHTVGKAYATLCDEGYIAVDRRKGAVALPPSRGEDFAGQLEERISLAAAEAVCRGMGREEFEALCSECYRKAKGA